MFDFQQKKKKEVEERVYCVGVDDTKDKTSNNNTDAGDPRICKTISIETSHMTGSGDSGNNVRLSCSHQNMAIVQIDNSYQPSLPRVCSATSRSGIDLDV